MKIFITGRSGFIATNLILRLQKDGHIIHSTSRDDNVVDKLSTFKPDVICHLAVENIDDNKMVDSNILLTHKILEYCRNNKVHKLLIFGSSSEYGCKSHPITEKDILEPKTIYEGTKAAASLLARSYAYTYKIPTVVIRPMSIYGPYEKKHKLMNTIFAENLMYLNGANHDWTYIDDFVEATIAIMNHEPEIFDIVNIGLGVQRSNHEVIAIAESLMGHKIMYKYVNGNLGLGTDSQMWVCDPTHLKTKYGFTPSITLEEGMKRFYNWRLANYYDAAYLHM